MRVRDYVSVWHWLGGRDAEQLAPAAIRYRAQVVRPNRGGCSGCLFKGQSAAVCGEAGRLAKLAGMPDCDDKDEASGRTHVYVRLELDPRQLGMVE